MFRNISSEKDLYGELIEHGKVLYPFESTKNNIRNPVFVDVSLKHKDINIKIGLGKEAWMKEYVSDSLENTWDQEKNKTRKLSNSRQL